jgi:hypothetical protein
MESKGERYSALIKSSRFGVAVGCTQHVLQGTTLSAAFVSVQHATVDEGTALTDYACVDLLKPRQITGAATGLASPSTIFRLGTGEGSSNTNARAGGFSVNAYAAPTEVVGSYDGGSPGASKVVRVSNVDPRQGTPISLDFGAGATPVSYPVTAPAGVPVLVSAHVRNQSDGRYLHLWSLRDQLAYSTMPSSLLRAGDLIRVGITATRPGATEESFLYLSAPGPASLQFGPAFTPTAPARTAAPGVRAAFSVSASADTLPQVSYQLSASTRAGSALAWQSVAISQRWFADAAITAYELPDFSGLPGWSNAMAMDSSVPLKWSVTRQEQSDKSYQAGLLVRTSMVSGELAN